MQKSNIEEHDNFYHFTDSETNNNNKYECNNPKCNITKFRKPDGTLRLRNPHIEPMDGDILYHLALDTKSHDLVEMFSDVKFVCMGGTAKRMQSFAHYIMKEIGHKLPTGTTLQDLAQNGHRYSLYKVGPVLSVSHGMGVSSISILLHEIIKLMYHAKAKDPIFFRIGTCGGIGLEAGSVVISDHAVDEMGNDYYEVPMLGKPVRRPAKLDQRLVEELKLLANPGDHFLTTTGTTVCAKDFYEGQGRTDGAFCDYAEEDKMAYLKQLLAKGVKNFEMEAVPFAAMTYHAGIKAADVCVTLLDRLKGDQVSTPKEVMSEWQNRPQILVGRYIKNHLQPKRKITQV